MQKILSFFIIFSLLFACSSPVGTGSGGGGGSSEPAPATDLFEGSTNPFLSNMVIHGDGLLEASIDEYGYISDVLGDEAFLRILTTAQITGGNIDPANIPSVSEYYTGLFPDGSIQLVMENGETTPANSSSRSTEVNAVKAEINLAPEINIDFGGLVDMGTQAVGIGGVSSVVDKVGDLLGSFDITGVIGMAGIATTLITSFVMNEKLDRIEETLSQVQEQLGVIDQKLDLIADYLEQMDGKLDDIMDTLSNVENEVIIVKTLLTSDYITQAKLAQSALSNNISNLAILADPTDRRNLIMNNILPNFDSLIDNYIGAVIQAWGAINAQDSVNSNYQFKVEASGKINNILQRRLTGLNGDGTNFTNWGTEDVHEITDDQSAFTLVDHWGANPKYYLPFTDRDMEFLAQMILYRFSLHAMVFQGTDLNNANRIKANLVLTSPTQLPAIKTKLNQAFVLFQNSYNQIMQQIDNAHDNWVMGPWVYHGGGNNGHTAPSGPSQNLLNRGAIWPFTSTQYYTQDLNTGVNLNSIARPTDLTGDQNPWTYMPMTSYYSVSGQPAVFLGPAGTNNGNNWSDPFNNVIATNASPRQISLAAHQYVGPDYSIFTTDPVTGLASEDVLVSLEEIETSTPEDLALLKEEIGNLYKAKLKDYLSVASQMASLEFILKGYAHNPASSTY